MSKEVKRYDPFGYDGLSALMHEDVLGDYVSWDDYDALRTELTEANADFVRIANERDALLAERDRLREDRDSQQRVCIAEMEKVNQLRAEAEALKKDAERYRWLRMADWWNSPLCVIRDPKQQAKPGTDCPSRDRLDEAIDAALQGDQP